MYVILLFVIIALSQLSHKIHCKCDKSIVESVNLKRIII